MVYERGYVRECVCVRGYARERVYEGICEKDM